MLDNQPVYTVTDRSLLAHARGETQSPVLIKPCQGKTQELLELIGDHQAEDNTTEEQPS